MLRALTLAIGQLFSGPILTVLGYCTMLSIACFVALWFGIDWAFVHWLGYSEESTGLVGILGGVATIVLAWFLFPIVASAFVALFLERVAKLVEQKHYPSLPKAKGITIAQSIAVSARFFLVLVTANVLLLFLLLFPPVYAVAWFVVNGWLLGREYFELVAMRRLAPQQTDALRKRNAFATFVTGVVLTALLLLPLVNLVLPVLATAVMVHRFHEWYGERL